MNFSSKIRQFYQRHDNAFLKTLGIVLITSSIVLLAGKLIWLLTPGGQEASLNGSEVAVMFFIIMLGMALAFPDLLSNRNKEASTMRIVVFMMVNVICLLLLKIGWDKEDLKAIGLDANWMGVIAFVFGAKATQSYFESKLAVPPTPVAEGYQQVTQSDIAKLAIVQNEHLLKIKYPNIASISDVVHDLNGAISHVVAIYLTDNNTVNLPDKLEAILPDKSVKTIPTEIIKNVGAGRIQISQANDNVSDSQSPLFKGSVCCLVGSTKDAGFIGLLTSGHIFSGGLFKSCDGLVPQQLQGSSLLNRQPAGSWYLQLINNYQDLAVVKLNAPPADDPALITMAHGYYEVTDADIATPDTNVTLISHQSKRDAFIIDYNVAFDIEYQGGKTLRMNNIILIGTERVRDNSKPVSIPGDSGCCVINKANKKLIGMLLGANDKYSFVLPVKDTLNTYHFKPL